MWTWEDKPEAICVLCGQHGSHECTGAEVMIQADTRIHLMADRRSDPLYRKWHPEVAA
jgi:hypothetical protein